MTQCASASLSSLSLSDDFVIELLSSALSVANNRQLAREGGRLSIARSCAGKSEGSGKLVLFKILKTSGCVKVAREKKSIGQFFVSYIAELQFE